MLKVKLKINILTLTVWARVDSNWVRSEYEEECVTIQGDPRVMSSEIFKSKGWYRECHENNKGSQIN
jgi:hypothetical protein